MMTMAELIKTRIDALAKTYTQKQIAFMLGYPNPNIVSMHKLGTAKVPFEKVPDYARVLGVDAGLVFRLWARQFTLSPAIEQMISERVITVAERDLLALARRLEPL